MTGVTAPKRGTIAYNKMLHDGLGENQALGDWPHWTVKLVSDIENAEGMDDFLIWPTVVEKMFVSENSTTKLMYGWLNDKWRQAARETFVGSPPALSFAPDTSGHLVYSAYHLQLWEEYSGRRVEDLMSIREFGGGYGSVALAARQAGFTGRYESVDLPASLMLQQYYSDHCQLELELNTLETAQTWRADLVIGLCSLSEAPMDTRAIYLDKVASSKSYLFRYQPMYEGHDNVLYFERFSQQFYLSKIVEYPTVGGPPGHRILVANGQSL